MLGIILRVKSWATVLGVNFGPKNFYFKKVLFCLEIAVGLGQVGD